LPACALAKQINSNPPWRTSTMQSSFWGLLDEPERPVQRIGLGPETVLLAGIAQKDATALYEDMLAVAAVSPLRYQTTAGGYEMSISNTNCGVFGWVSDRRGYRYDMTDPLTGRPWPEMPPRFGAMARKIAREAGFIGFEPDACLINRYVPGARLSLHQDRSERDMNHPVVTISLGLPAVFQWGGNQRSDRTASVSVVHGDAIVWGGVDRLRFHGVKQLADGEHILAGRSRYSLTFRKAS
jgi:alkylated DNA repair protein (DNA oxidative demethylase)